MSNNCAARCCLGKDYPCTTYNALCCIFSPFWLGCCCVKKCCLETFDQQNARRSKEIQKNTRSIAQAQAPGNTAQVLNAAGQPIVVMVTPSHMATSSHTATYPQTLLPPPQQTMPVYPDPQGYPMAQAITH